MGIYGWLMARYYCRVAFQRYSIEKKDWFARVPRPAGHTTIQLDTYSYTALVTEFHLQAVHLLHNK